MESGGGRARGQGMRDKEAFFTYSQASSFGGTVEGSRCKRFSGGGEAA